MHTHALEHRQVLDVSEQRAGQVNQQRETLPWVACKYAMILGALAAHVRREDAGTI